MIWWEPSNNYLEHHGILGMKWGVRRYQNPDGSLTPEGRARYSSLYKSSGAEERFKQLQSQYDQQLARSGIQVGNNGTDIIKKGSVIKRVTNKSNETLDSKRKYGYLTPDDAEVYESEVRYMLGADLSKRDNTEDPYNHWYVDEYEAKRDLKVANAKTVADHIVSKYGDISMSSIKVSDYAKATLFTGENKELLSKTLKEVYSEFGADTRASLTKAETIRRSLAIGDRDDVELASYVANRIRAGGSAMSYMLNHIMYGNTDAKNMLMSDIKKMGYDAMVDIEDYMGLADYPVILLNPADSVKKTRQREI